MADNDFNSDGFPKDFSPRDFSETPRHRAEDAAKDVKGTSAADVNELKEFGSTDANQTLEFGEPSSTPRGESPSESSPDSAVSSSQPDSFGGLSQPQVQADNHRREGALNSAQQPHHDFGRPKPQDASEQFGAPSGNVNGQGAQQSFGQYPQGPQSLHSAGNYNQGFNQQAQAFGTNSQATRKEDGFFSGLFDFKFNKFITVEHAQAVYIIAMIIGALVWLANVLGGFVFSGVLGSMAYELDIPTGAGFSIFVIFFNFVASTVGFFFYIISVRLVLEMMVSNVRIAQNTRDLLNK